MIEFLWASLALFDEPDQPETATVYRPRPFEPYPVAEARGRILRILGEVPEGAPLDRFLPAIPEISEGAVRGKMRVRPGWASTLMAGLELAKMGDVVLGQGRDFETIRVAPA